MNTRDYIIVYGQLYPLDTKKQCVKMLILVKITFMISCFTIVIRKLLLSIIFQIILSFYFTSKFGEFVYYERNEFIFSEIVI